MKLRTSPGAYLVDNATRSKALVAAIAADDLVYGCFEVPELVVSDIAGKIGLLTDLYTDWAPPVAHCLSLRDRLPWRRPRVTDFLEQVIVRETLRVAAHNIEELLEPVGAPVDAYPCILSASPIGEQGVRALYRLAPTPGALALLDRVEAEYGRVVR